MSNPNSKEDKKRRILAALEGRALPGEIGGPTPLASKSEATPMTAKAGDISGMMDRSPKASTKVISEFVDENPDKALAVFRGWMSE